MIRFLFSLLVLAIVVWFATNVPLGTRTLWGHLRAISDTKEAKEFADGTKQEARKVADQLLSPKDAGAPDLARPSHHPLDEVDDHDRKKLDELTRPQKKHHR